MTTFVEKYVRRPIAEVDQWASNLLNLSVEQTDESTFILSLYDCVQRHAVSIERQEDPSLALDAEDEDSDQGNSG